MKKILFLFLLFLVPLTQAMNVTIEPEEPKAGDTVTVYAKINNVSNVELKYCIGDVCKYIDMVKENDTWVASFKAEEGEVELAIIIDGEIVWQDKIEVTKKQSPAFELFIVAIALLMVFISRRR